METRDRKASHMHRARWQIAANRGAIRNLPATASPSPGPPGLPSRPSNRRDPKALLTPRQTLTTLAAPFRYRVVVDAEGWPVIPGRLGQIELHDRAGARGLQHAPADLRSALDSARGPALAGRGSGGPRAGAARAPASGRQPDPSPSTTEGSTPDIRASPQASRQGTY